MIGFGGGPAGAFGASGKIASGSLLRPLGFSSLDRVPLRSRKVGSTASAAVTSTSPGSWRRLLERLPRPDPSSVLACLLIVLQVGTGRSSTERAATGASSTIDSADFRGALPLTGRAPRFLSAAASWTTGGSALGAFTTLAGLAAVFAVDAFLRNSTREGSASAWGSNSVFLLPRDFFSSGSGLVSGAVFGFFLAMF